MNRAARPLSPFRSLARCACAAVGRRSHGRTGILAAATLLGWICAAAFASPSLAVEPAPTESRDDRADPAGAVAANTEPRVHPGGDGDAGNPAPLVIQPRDLSGEDREKARTAAHLLLKTITEGEGDRTRERHKTFLQLILSPETLANGEIPWLCTQSVLEELTQWIPREGLPYATLSADLLPLLGRGPDSFRTAFVGAAVVLIAHEEQNSEGDAGSTTFSRLRESTVRLQLATEPAFRDAAAILWLASPRGALATLVEALAGYSEQENGDEAMMWVCLDELRQRVAVDFPTSAAWREWWERVRTLPLEAIFIDYQKEAVERQVVTWRKLLGRLRETQDAERVLLAIQDSLLELTRVEERLAVVAELEQFAGWLRGLPAPVATAEERQELALRAAEQLLGVVERQRFELESPDVVRSALAAIGAYQSSLEKTDQFDDRLHAIVIGNLRVPPGTGKAGERAIFRESVELAGLLRLEEARPYLEAYLQSVESVSEANDDLLNSAITAFGRLAHTGMRDEMARLLIRHVQRDGGDTAVRDLRRAAMTALSGAVGNEELRPFLLEFYRQALVDLRDKPLRVRSILGLGALAQLKVEGALDSLVELLRAGEQYPVEEVLAAVDAIASYIAPPDALAVLVPYLTAKRKQVGDHVRGKVVAFIESSGLPAAAETSQRLVTLGGEDPACWAAAGVLFASPALVKLIDAAQADFAAPNVARDWWTTRAGLILAADMSGDDLALETGVAFLRDTLRKSPEIAERHPDATKELEVLDASLGRRRALAEVFDGATAIDPERLANDVIDAFRAETDPTRRAGQFLWFERRVRALAPERAAPVAGKLQGPLAATPALWEGVAPRLRERLLGSLGELAGSPKDGEN